MRRPSHTVVLEAAVFLLQRGLLGVRDLGHTNVKQGRALLIWAAWLQHKKSLEWVADPKVKLPREGLVQVPKWLEQLIMIFVGGAGTGKTTTILVIEALVDFFYGAESMRKSAPTNTASRLIGGDTLHASYKLPLG
eukprot:3559969-Karenia_brevis.AAC.1